MPFGSNNMTVPIRNVYPFARGAAPLGVRSSAVTPGIGYEQSAGNSQGLVEEHSPVAAAGEVAKQGNPLSWWLALAGLYVVGGYLAQRVGTDGEFANVKLTPYNVFVITLAAILGISMAKFIFTKYPVPGLSAVVLAL